jgi:hypothetical protein
MPAGRTTAAYNPADYDEFGNYIGGAPAPAPPPPAQDTGGALPMADQSMYAAPIEAKYQPGGEQYRPPYDPGAAYGAATGPTAYESAPPPPTDAYNSAPSTPLPAPPPPVPSEVYGGAAPPAPYSPYSDPSRIVSTFPAANQGTSPRTAAGTMNPDYTFGEVNSVVPVNRNSAGLDKPFAPPVLTTYDKQDAVVGGWRGGRYVSPSETQAALDAVAATGQPVGNSTGPLETIGNLVGSGASALGALGTGIADFFAPPPVDAQEQPTRTITGAPDPTLAATPPTVTSLPDFKSPGYAAQQNQNASSGNPWGRMMGDLVSNISGNWDPSFSREPGASPEAYGRYGQMAFDEAEKARREGYLQHANFRPAAAPAPTPVEDAFTQRNAATQQELEHGTENPMLGSSARRAAPGTIAPDRTQRTPAPIGDDILAAGGSLSDAIQSGSGYPNYIPGSTYVPPSNRGIGAKPEATTKTSSGPKRPSSILDPSAYLSQLAKNDDRTFNDQSEQGKFIERLIADKYLDKNGNFTAVAGADGTLKNGTWTQVAVDAGLVSADKLGKKASFVDMLPYQAAKGAPAGVTESTASETPATGAPAANSGAPSNSGGNSDWVDYGGGGSRSPRSSGGNWGGSSGRSYGSRSSRSFGDDGEVSNRWQDYAEDEDGDGQFSAAEIKRAKFRMKQAQKRRGKKGRFGKGGSNVPSFPDSPQRQLVLSNLSGAFDEAFANFPKPR